VAIVTGRNSGIGMARVLARANEDADVVIDYFSDEAAA
jgi:NAD(P)-dependent dehydrogenase (short-subunit alcohol dehydrogenase family)